VRQELTGDIARTAHDIEELRDEARRLEVKAAEAAQQFARELASRGIPVRDAAELLGISPHSQTSSAPLSPVARRGWAFLSYRVVTVRACSR
jgi:hypothetical protein